VKVHVVDTWMRLQFFFHLFSRSIPLDVFCVVVCFTVRYSVLSKRQCCRVLPCVAASPAHHAVDRV